MASTDAPVSPNDDETSLLNELEVKHHEQIVRETSSDSLSPSVLPLPPRRVSRPENPPSSLSHWIELHPIGRDERAIPEVAPGPISLYMDLHPLESGDPIPEQTPEPQLSWIELHPPSTISILVSIDDRIKNAEGSRIGFAVRLDRTLGSFKELLLNKHAFDCAEHSLILLGREIKDDEQTLGDLGFVEGCTLHAVAVVQLSVATLAGEDYKFALKATTLISEIRKLLREVDADMSDQDDCAFSLDGVHTLQESRTLWDLNIYSGTTLILSGYHSLNVYSHYFQRSTSTEERRLITLSIQYFGLASNFHERLGTKLEDKISIHDSVSLDDLRAQVLAMVPSAAKGGFQPPNQVYVSHRGKPLDGTRTIRERLEDGDVVDVTWMALERRIPEEREEREQIDSDISCLAG
ncbi:hypothetical protein FIBSPDRAFT_931733 [Athelia psychrophila]|uniref:Ubiquitin-like domain-containing protein n=1 Tax=Athelia psychrophila TaxID=1759441 RepID=A0A166JXG5_9AGAM|nr:hypothetical protein FIBSPDRAFT_931733 [Fibularhizoctonia sp. CBS 109695]